MKFKFPLQKVLEHRKTKEDLAQNEFQDALNDLNTLIRRLGEMETLVKQAHVQAYEMQIEGGNQGAALSQINDFIRNQKIIIEEQRQRIAQQEVLVEQKRDLLRAAAVETKVIDKFKEKKFEEFKKKVEGDEQKEMDDQSVLRYKNADQKESA
jgi:flagellar FliJ protein